MIHKIKDCQPPWLIPSIEKGILIEYPYILGFTLGNSDFVTIWLEFDLLVRTIVQSKWNKR